MAEKSRRVVTRFHPTHGENIVLREDSTVAYRTASFANSLAFSEKPLQPGEIFLIEIEKTEQGWSGHMRLGLTLIDPASVNNGLPEYAMPNLVKLGNTWIFAITKSHNIWDGFEGEGISSREKKLITDGVNVQTSRGVVPFNALRPNTIGSSQYILPTDAGSRIGIMYVPQVGSKKAEMHFIINGEDQGVCGRDIPYKAGPLRAVVDVYGTTKQVRIIQLYGGTYPIEPRAISPPSLLINFANSLPYVSSVLLKVPSSFLSDVCFSSIDFAKRLPGRYTPIYQKERSSLASASSSIKRLFTV